MDFKQWLVESSLNDLYDSAVEAFPHTTKRQHATGPIVISHLDWVPYLGVKTLLVKGIAQNEDREYNPVILFTGVRYHENGEVEIAADNKTYRFDPLINNQVRVWCNCADFRWRFRYYDHLDHSLYGSKGKKYIANGAGQPANPLELPGACKHLMKLSSVLEQGHLFG